MERRVLLAIFLAFLVLYAWQALFVKPAPKPGTTSGATAPAAASGSAPTGPAATESAAAAGTSTPAGSAEGTMPPPAETAAAPLVGETAERDVRVETSEVIAV